MEAPDAYSLQGTSFDLECTGEALTNFLSSDSQTTGISKVITGYVG